ncbi:hypothetical protein FRC07_002967 [Ceratobasidium sp. 392]|nr:hypothetical protein FRC07_002967 [Ceratobasidium sp. 392]
MAHYALGDSYSPRLQPLIKAHRLRWVLSLSDFIYSPAVTEARLPFDVDPEDFEDDNFSPDIHFDDAYTPSHYGSISSNLFDLLLDTSEDFSDLGSTLNHTVCTDSPMTSVTVKRPLVQSTLPFKSIPREEWLAIVSRRYHERKDQYEEELERHKLTETKKKAALREHNWLCKRAQRRKQKLARQAAGISSKNPRRQSQQDTMGLSLRHSVATLSRPHSSSYKTTSPKPSKTAPCQKSKPTPSHRVNWTSPLLWSQIESTAIAVGYPWFPSEIVRQLQLHNPALFSTLRPQRISQWRDHRFPNELRWTDSHMRSVEAGDHPKSSGGRTGVLHDYPEIVHAITRRLSDLRNAGIALDIDTIPVFMAGVIRHHIPDIFTQPDSSGRVFQCSRGFVRTFLHRNLGWSVRKATRAVQKLPSDVNTVLFHAFLRFARLVRDEEIPSCCIVNVDRTQIVYNAGTSTTWNTAGERQVHVLGVEEKRAFTLLVAAALSGDLLPMQAIYGGQTARSLPDHDAPGCSEARRLGFLLDYSGLGTYWSTQATMQRFVSEILAPYFRAQISRHGLPRTQRCILQVDCWSVHRSAEFRNWMSAQYPWITILYVPGGCTGLFQACDVGLQRMLKLAIRQASHNDVVAETVRALESGTSPEDVVNDQSRQTLRNRSVNWILQGYNAINDQDIVQKNEQSENHAAGGLDRTLDEVDSIIPALQNMTHDDRTSFEEENSTHGRPNSNLTPSSATIPNSPKTDLMAVLERPQTHEKGSANSGTHATGSVIIPAEASSDDNPTNPSNEAVILGEIGNLHMNQYRQRGQLQDINIAIACHGQAASMTPEGDPLKFVRLGNVGSDHLLRFSQLGQLPDLETAIVYHSQAVAMIPDGHPQKFGMLANLGGSHLSRFERLGKLEDLDMTIRCHSRAMWLMPEDHSFKPALMNNLGQSFYSRFERLGDIIDLDNAIESQSRSVELTSDIQPTKAGRLNNLGRSLLARFEHLGQASDLNMAIDCQTKSVSQTPNDHPEQAIRFQDLANSYHARFKLLEDALDLQSAVELFTKALDLIPSGHPDRPVFLKNLANVYSTRYRSFGELQDLETTISFLSQAVTLLTNDHRIAPFVFNNLGNALSTRCSHLGNLADLDKAIDLQLKAAGSVSDNHPNKAKWLSNLGTAYRDRYQRLGDYNDIEQAVSCQNKALLLTPDQHPILYAVLINGGAAFFTRFLCANKLEDLNTAVERFNQALSISQPENSNKHTLFNNLGISYYSRFRNLGETTDLEKAIELQTQAVSLLADVHPDKPSWLNNLGLSHHARFKQFNQASDLDKAIELYTQAAVLIPSDHPLQCALQHNLGASFQSQFDRLDDSSFLDQSLECFERATRLLTGPPSTRLTAARDWAKLAFVHKPDTARDAYAQAMALIPRVVWLGSTISHRYDRIEEIGDIALEASTVAIACHDYGTALEWFEEGRSIVWKQLLHLRAPLDELPTLDEQLAQELKQVSRELESVSTTSEIFDDVPAEVTSFEQVVQQHHRLAERWEQLVNQVRLLPGMESFLSPRKVVELLATARTGAVVSVVVHSAECHALIIRQNSSDVTHLALPSLSLQKIHHVRLQLARSLRRQGRGDRGVTTALNPEAMLEAALLMLWTDLTKPILELLGYLESPVAQELPRITWCTTGALNFLPLHAAGDYSQAGHALFDFAISSYTPFLSALLAPVLQPNSLSGMLAIGQASTHGFSPLPGTIFELDNIQEQFQHMRFTRLDGENATISAVLSAIPEHSWVHFACHASQNLNRPTMSAFHLQGGALDLATLTRSSLPHARLAFLSACQTATGDESLPEEAVHLAAGIMAAGYRTVVASMWSIDDADAPIVTKNFYRYMLEDGRPSERDAARALHDAVGRLRAQVGVKMFGRWVPYIHIGI